MPYATVLTDGSIFEHPVAITPQFPSVLHLYLFLFIEASSYPQPPPLFTVSDYVSQSLSSASSCPCNKYYLTSTSSLLEIYNINPAQEPHKNRQNQPLIRCSRSRVRNGTTPSLSLPPLVDDNRQTLFLHSPNWMLRLEGNLHCKGVH